MYGSLGRGSMEQAHQYEPDAPGAVNGAWRLDLVGLRLTNLVGSEYLTRDLEQAGPVVQAGLDQLDRSPQVSLAIAGSHARSRAAFLSPGLLPARAQLAAPARRTVLVIAHRLSTVVAAHQIVVLEGGRLVERGNHAELVEAGGKYKELWDHQRQQNDG